MAVVTSIFVSGVSKEFATARSAIDRTIRTPDINPVVQEVFPPDFREVKQMLVSRLKRCDALIHLVGFAYGMEPKQNWPRGKRCSYTQLEYVVARKLKIPLYVFVAEDAMQLELQSQEAPELRRLQEKHRKRVTNSDNLWNTFRTQEELLEKIARIEWPRHDDPRGLKPCNLPFDSIGSLFKGRESLLDDLYRTLKVDAKQVVHGLGGVGKSRLAVEFAWRYQAEYTAILFVTADSPPNLASNLARLAVVLNLDEQIFPEQDAQVQAVLRELASRHGWLLILDNIDTEPAAEAVDGLLPKLQQGHVLMTGRLSNWSPEVHELPLDVLDNDASTTFLLERTAQRRRQAPTDEEDARTLASDLGGLALALEQAGAYIHVHRCSLVKYHQRWQEQDQRVHQFYDRRLMKYPAPVAKSWLTTIEQLSDPAQSLLNILSFLSSEPIPSAWADANTSVMIMEESLAELSGYSLVKYDGDAFTIHRLVQEVTRSTIPPDELCPSIKQALAIVNARVPVDPPPDDIRSWPVYERLYPHAVSVIEYGVSAGITAPTTRLMTSIASFLMAKCVFDLAEDLYRRALAIDKQSYGADHANVATDLNNLSRLLQETNRLSEAEPLMRRALAIVEQCYGPEHPKVALQLNNMAMLLRYRNRIEQAEPLMRRALAIDEKILGDDHPRVAIRLSNLAMLFQYTNRLEEAEPLIRRALAIDEQSYGADHPNVATALNNLAHLLQATNRLEEAEPLMRRALAIDEKSYGDEHLDVARDLGNLGELLRMTERLSEAERLLRRALGIATAKYGKDHPNSAVIGYKLAMLEQEKGNTAEARRLLRDSLAVFRASFGDDHFRIRETFRRMREIGMTSED